MCETNVKMTEIVRKSFNSWKEKIRYKKSYRGLSEIHRGQKAD